MTAIVRVRASNPALQTTATAENGRLSIITDCLFDGVRFAREPARIDVSVGVISRVVKGGRGNDGLAGRSSHRRSR